MKMSSLITATLAAVMMAAQPAFAGDPSRGLEKSQACQACHGREGNTVPDDQTPRLAGQYEDYLVHALKAYRSGDREHAVMASFASDLSDQDISDLAAWYASQEGLKTLRIK